MLDFEKIAEFRSKIRPGLYQVLSNTVWLFGDKLLEVGFGLLVGVWVARYLGPEQFGTYNFAISFAVVFSQIGKLGLDSLVVRELSKHGEDKHKIIGTSFFLQLAGSAVCSLLPVALIFWVKPEDVIVHALVAIISFSSLFNSFNVINLWFQSQLQAKNSVIARRTVYIILLVARVILIKINASLVFFGCLFLAEVFLNAAMLALIYHRTGEKIFFWRFSSPLAKKLLHESWPLIFAGLTVYMYSKIDQVMLGTFMADQSELGYYSVAVKLSEFFDFIPLILSSTLLPKLTQRKFGGGNYLQGLQVFFDIMFLSWLMVAVPVSIFSGRIVDLLYGPAYGKAGAILAIYVWAQFGTNFGVARSSFLVIEGKTKISLSLSVLGAVTNILLNLYTIPRYGAMGATLSTLFTYFLVTIGINFILQDLRPISWMIVSSANIFKSIQRIKKALA